MPLIIKHIENLDDRSVVDAIQENPYIQFFIGLKEFDPQPVFDSSLFVEIRVDDSTIVYGCERD
jgi:hypothetical protein